MEIKDSLTKAREIISDPNHWTQSAYARDKDSIPISSYDRDAHSFCMLGALLHVTKDDLEIFKVAKAYLSQQIANTDIDSVATVAGFNDHHTHQEVLTLLDQAIENCP